MAAGHARGAFLSRNQGIENAADYQRDNDRS
jgi:hypothetical protein